MKGKLYLVPTPIGNLGDMTIRAIEVLQAVSVVLVEDTRVTKKLFQKYDISTPMQPYHEHNKDSMLVWVLKTLKHKQVAIVSDAGTPAISDPGYELIQACLEKNIPLESLPGASALLPALTISGLPTNAFTFAGFPPRKQTQRKKFFNQFKNLRTTLIFYESPHRVVEFLRDLKTVLGDRKISVSRELTKKYESTYRLTVSEAITIFKYQQIAGEVVICVAGVDKDSQIWNQPEVLKALMAEQATGKSLSQAAKSVAQLSGWKKSTIYELGLDQ